LKKLRPDRELREVERVENPEIAESRKQRAEGRIQKA